MNIRIVSLFPEFFTSPLEASLLGKARESGLLTFSFHTPRAMAQDKHSTVDDRPYGGGPGMVMLAEPMAQTLLSLGFTALGQEATPVAMDTLSEAGDSPEPDKTSSHHVPQLGRLLFMSPTGTPLTQGMARSLATEEQITLICGRYEGLDARIATAFPLEHVSLGDFVLNGGESAALALIEAITRLLPGFMGHEDSVEEESFSQGLLEHPHYTRPEEWQGQAVPAVLRSGDHARIAQWRHEASLSLTLQQRPELLEEYPLTKKDKDFLRTIPLERPGRNLFCALVHYPVLDKEKKSVAVSLTNLDIHDIGRSSCSYGLGGLYITTPIPEQQKLLQELLGHWVDGPGTAKNPDRAVALSRIMMTATVEEAVEAIFQKTGEQPMLVATSAQGSSSLGFRALRDILRQRPVLLLLGTGHGLAPELLAHCDAMVPAIRWHGGYNHLSVRAAAAITLDRILGDWY